MIYFFSQDVPAIRQKRILKKWLHKIADNYDKSINDINFVFCTDEYLLEINKQYLQHDYYTDIITFDLSETPGNINGEVYISWDRVEANAKELNVPFLTELYRVMAHGLLHLIGFQDHTEEQKLKMHKEEDKTLSYLSFLS